MPDLKHTLRIVTGITSIAAAAFLIVAPSIGLGGFGVENVLQISAFILIVVITQQITFHSEVLEKFKTVIELAKGPVLSQSLTQNRFYEEFRSHLISAKKCVDITSHEPRLPSSSGLRAKRDSWELIFDRAKKEPDVLFRLIIAVKTKPRYDWVVRNIRSLNPAPNVSIRHSDFDAFEDFPRNSVQIIDKKSVFVIDPAQGYHTSNDDDIDFYSVDAAVVEHFQRFFDMYWSRCHPLMEGSEVMEGNITELGRLLRPSNS